MTRIVLFLLAIGPALAFGQGVDTDSLRRAARAEIERQRTQSTTAATRFLDRARPSGERLAAVRNVAAFAEQQHVDGATAIALDPREPLAIRVRALQLVGPRAGTDTTFARRLFAVATDTAVPVDLRHEAVTQLSFATFGSFAMHAQLDGFLAALRAAARDPEVRIRRAALRALAGQGDEKALTMLKGGLESPRTALLPPSEAVQLLGVRDPAPFYDLLRRLMREPPDTATRVAAIQLLGGDVPSRGSLVEVLHDSREALETREAALGALAAGDRRGLPQHLLPVAADEAAPLDLRLRAIKTVEMTRTSRDPRVVARAPDDFDRLMTQLAEASPAPAVRAAARAYLTRTRSAR